MAIPEYQLQTWANLGVIDASIKTHDLIYLVKKCELQLPGNHLDFIGKINTASIPTRYPDDLQRSLKEYPKSVAKDYLNQTIELV